MNSPGVSSSIPIDGIRQEKAPGAGYGTMNLFVIKYALLIGAVLTSTALVAGPLNPQQLFSSDSSTGSGQITADAIYQFGSDTLYKEIDQPGNEYMKANLQGYSKELVPTEQIAKDFREKWSGAVSQYATGYQGSVDAFIEMAGISQMKEADEKKTVCDKFRRAKEDLRSSEQSFLAAKASSTAGSSDGFTIGMVIPRVDRISSDAEDAEMACMKSVVADRNGDSEGFHQGLMDAKQSLADMRRLNAELKVLSDDFP